MKCAGDIQQLTLNWRHKSSSFHKSSKLNNSYVRSRSREIKVTFFFSAPPHLNFALDVDLCKIGAVIAELRRMILIIIQYYCNIYG